MRKLKFEGIAQVGDTIRAYDFEPMAGRPDHYIEGVVCELTTVKPHGYKAYDIRLTYDSMGVRPIGTAVYVPMETGMDYDNRVEKIS
jgi:hypothetical protein